MYWPMIFLLCLIVLFNLLPKESPSFMVGMNWATHVSYL